jgi:uncharacterized repeat protein (TIGR03803 family)
MRPRRFACFRKLNWGNRAGALLLLCAMITIASSAQTFTSLHDFQNTDGAGPNAPLIQATDGNLYGLTSDGGSIGLTDGNIFRITPGGALTSLFSFDGMDGAAPYLAGLVQATNGNFYGTTGSGGANSSDRGTVFGITPGGVLTTLHSFCPPPYSCPDGAYPFAGLVQGTDGNFYGTTTAGGANSGCANTCGTAFKITPSGVLTTLYSFCSQSECTDGESPYAGLIQGTDGNFYGTTLIGGANAYGEVFKITSNGKLAVLHSFCPTCGEGSNPTAGLVQATDGNFYGTTLNGGTDNYGTVFEITPSGKLTTLHSFAATDGAAPSAALIQATDGNFYGTTEFAGANGGAGANYGTIFKITPRGKLTTLYSFCPVLQNGICPDGNASVAAVVQDTDGTFYGTTNSGGNLTYNAGTVFSLATGLGPFLKTLPTSGKVGAAVRILGTNLTGSTSVTFNGTSAVFKVISSSEITTTVPTGATTGKVQVTTPGGPLTSNVSFRVRP